MCICIQSANLLDVCQPVSDVASRRHLRSAGRRLLNVPHQRRSTFGLSLWLARWCGTRCRTIPERPGSQQRHFLQASKDVFVGSVLIYVQRIRAFTTMRYINLRFTYLLTYLLTYGVIISILIVNTNLNTNIAGVEVFGLKLSVRSRVTDSVMNWLERSSI